MNELKFYSEIIDVIERNVKNEEVKEKLYESLKKSLDGYVKIYLSSPKKD